MQPIFRKATLLALLLAVTSVPLSARNGKPVYQKAHNPHIGITVENAVGAPYTIRNEEGKIIVSGAVKSDKTFFISTGKLAKGAYRFMIGSLVLQEFIIR